MAHEWTQEARAQLDLLLEAAVPGADEAALKSRAALRARIEADLESQHSAPFTALDIEASVRRLGLQSLREQASAAPPKTTGRRRSARSGCAPAWFLLACVLGPLLVLVVEHQTGMCADEFFDPIPTLGHALLIAGVAVAGALGLVALRPQANSKSLARASFALGFGLPIACVYFLAFLPLLPVAVLVVVIGLGLLPLVPIVCLPSLVWLASKVANKSAIQGESQRRRFWTGAAASVFLLLLLDAPPIFTRKWVHVAATGAAPERARALGNLRSFGSEEALRRLASGDNETLLGPWWMLAWYGSEVSTEEAREVWFRIHGTAFRGPLSARRPSFFGGWTDTDALDPDLGGTTVGVGQPGLSLEASKLDVAVDGTSGLAYMEWVFEVLNSNASGALEARAILALPDEAVVSRATLWVGGEEREAAYAGSSTARAAYEQVAVRQRRDPLLVSSAGDDLVLLQAFPVLAGQRMKWKIGISVPLELLAESARVPWPRLLDRNFALAPELAHSVWFSSHEELVSEGLSVTRTAEGWDARGLLAAGALGPADPAPELRVRRNQPDAVACAFDETRELVCSFAPQVQQARPAPVVVVEGSRALRPWAEEIARGLRELFAAESKTVIVADDAGVRSFELAPGSDPAELLDADTWRGGVDGVLALERGWDRARELGTDVVWICGPLPQLLSPLLGLEQRFERDPQGPRIVCCMLAFGENRVLLELADQARIERAGFSGDVSATLRHARGNPAIQRGWKIVERSAVALPKGPKHLLALWASARVEELLLEVPARRDEALELAQSQHLVTRVSSAVVLENAQQFAENGLSPAEAEALPSVPEPEIVVLLMVALAALLWAARRKRMGLAA
jgi:hypothetical protein